MKFDEAYKISLKRDCKKLMRLYWFNSASAFFTMYVDVENPTQICKNFWDGVDKEKLRELEKGFDDWIIVEDIFTYLKSVLELDKKEAIQ